MFGIATRRNRQSLGLSASERLHAADYQSIANAVTEPNYASRYILKGFLSYISGLYSEGEISREAYTVLVNQAAILSAEAMTMGKVQALVDKYEEYFVRITEDYLSATE